MNKLIAYFIKFPIWANAVIVVTAIAGILSLFIMPKSFFPEMTPNRVYINVAYPGASPKEIEEGITTKVEESLNGIQGVKEITSTLIKASSEENSTIIKEVNPEYSNKVINQTKSEIPDNVSQTVEPLVTLPLEIIREATSDQAKENEPALEERSLNIAYSNSSSQNGNEKSREIKTIKKRFELLKEYYNLKLGFWYEDLESGGTKVKINIPLES